jgi:hypothetical protein
MYRGCDHCCGVFIWPWVSSIRPRRERPKPSRHSRPPDYSSRNLLPTYQTNAYESISSSKPLQHFRFRRCRASLWRVDNTYPQPDGERFEGQEAVRHFWEEFFRSSPDAVFESEEMVAHGDRCVIRWRYNWTNTDGSRGHIRGVDVLRV